MKKHSITSRDSYLSVDLLKNGNTSNFQSVVCHADTPQGSKPFSIPFINYWKGFFAFGYFTLIIPFRLKKNDQTGKLEMHSCWLQKILCAMMQTVLLFDFTSLFWSTYWSASKDSNFSYFTSLTYIGYVAYHISLNYTFWFKQPTFCSVFDKLQNLTFYSEFSARKSKTFMKVISIGFCAIILLMALTESTLVNNLYVHADLKLYYEYLSQKAQLHFLFIKPGNVSKDGFCFLPIFVTVIQIVVLLPSLILVPFLDVFVLLIPFSIWRMMCGFQRYYTITIGGPMSMEKILRKYWMIKSLLKDVNKAVGLILCCCVSVSLPYYATWSAVTYFKENVHSVTLLHVYGFFIVFFLTLILAADINKKGMEFYSWINNQGVSTKILTSLLVDLNSNEIALKGIGFQVSYRFLGTILGVIITYSIITIQVQLSRKGFENTECNCSVVNV
ncbi:uncharacterized protein LOC118435150 [Folsomia candida]|uniref:uncharacterized protein LOC118435150 n=1 Tax=Folsomia candida TaxID=158441 RepID=UPI001604B4E5|nr:uncharacterized protein LOC118435150 [Folsomia candida]